MIRARKVGDPKNDLGIYDKAQAATGKSGRTTPNVTLTPIDPMPNKRKVGKTVSIGGAKERKIRKPNKY